MEAPPPELPHSDSQVVSSLAECGLSREGIRVEYIEEYDEYLIIVEAEVAADAERFECYFDALRGLNIRFPDAEVTTAYSAYASERYRAAAIAETRAVLAERGIDADTIPTLESVGSLEILAPQLEGMCGMAAGSVLQISGDALLFEPPIAPDQINYEDVGCLFYLVRASGVTNFGFIGNEKLAGGDD